MTDRSPDPVTDTTRCSTCNGSGRVNLQWLGCPDCGGSGRVTDADTMLGPGEYGLLWWVARRGPDILDGGDHADRLVARGLLHRDPDGLYHLTDKAHAWITHTEGDTDGR